MHIHRKKDLQHTWDEASTIDSTTNSNDCKSSQMPNTNAAAVPWRQSVTKMTRRRHQSISQSAKNLIMGRIFVLRIYSRVTSWQRKNVPHHHNDRTMLKSGAHTAPIDAFLLDSLPLYFWFTWECLYFRLWIIMSALLKAPSRWVICEKMRERRERDRSHWRHDWQCTPYPSFVDLLRICPCDSKRRTMEIGRRELKCWSRVLAACFDSIES
jgi:hypothetical protein